MPDVIVFDQEICGKTCAALYNLIISIMLKTINYHAAGATMIILTARIYGRRGAGSINAFNAMIHVTVTAMGKIQGGHAQELY